MQRITVTSCHLGCTQLEVSRSSLGHINRHTRRALARQRINHSLFTLLLVALVAKVNRTTDPIDPLTTSNH